MAFTRKQSACVSFPWSELQFSIMENRPIHKPVMKGQHDVVEVRTDDGTIFQWFPDGDVSRKTPAGELTTWWATPTMAEIVNRNPDGAFCRFYSDGRVTMSRDTLTWFWGPPVLGDFVEGTPLLVSCTCPDCVDDHLDRYAYRD